MSNPYHIVVANKAAARVYIRPSNGGIHSEYISLQNDSARKSLSELESDRVGRSYDRHGPGRHALSMESDSRQVSTERFAKQVMTAISNLLRSSTTKDYVIVAAPEFLGILRHEIESAPISAPLFDLDKDISDQTVDSVLAAIERR